MSEYTALLKASGLKATFQRLGILEIIEKMGHASIEDIYSEIRETQPTLSLATIYKNILTMVEKEILVEVPLAGAKSKYELKKHEHIHLICQKCGSVEDEELIEDPQRSFAKLLEKDSFTLTSSQVNLYGLCRNCQLTETS